MTRDADGSALEGPPPMPRWVKVFVILGLLALLAGVVLVVVGGGLGGEHGPGRHLGGDDDGAGETGERNGNDTTRALAAVRAPPFASGRA